MFKIIWAHGVTETGFNSLDDAEAAIRSVLGAAAEIGHDGDIAGGGERTLFWADAADAENDDGMRAKGKIVRLHGTVR